MVIEILCLRSCSGREIPQLSFELEGLRISITSSAGFLVKSPNRHTLSPMGSPEPRSEIEAFCHPLSLSGSAASNPSRAWTAGCWAAAMVRAGASFSNPSVFHSPDCSHVQVTTSRDKYPRLVDHHRSNPTMSHGFPTDTEARISVAGAARTYPAPSSI